MAGRIHPRKEYLVAPVCDRRKPMKKRLRSLPMASTLTERRYKLPHPLSASQHLPRHAPHPPPSPPEATIQQDLAGTETSFTETPARGSCNNRSTLIEMTCFKADSKNRASG